MSDPDAFSIPRQSWETFDLWQFVVDTFDDPIFVKDRQHRWIAANMSFCAILGQPRATIIGKSDPDFFPAEQAQIFWAGDDRVFISGQPDASEEPQTRADGTQTTIWTRKWPLIDTGGVVVGLCGSITDITIIRQRQESVALLERELSERTSVIEAQLALLDQIGVPVIQIWDRVLLLPLVATLDSRRVSILMESLLTAISTYHAQVVLIDITGVPIVDSEVANLLLRAVQAAQLLGCSCILVGIRPEIAQTVVSLGANFNQIPTRARLQEGLELALMMLKYRVTRT